MDKEQEKLIKTVNAELEEWLCSGDTERWQYSSQQKRKYLPCMLLSV